MWDNIVFGKSKLAKNYKEIKKKNNTITKLLKSWSVRNNKLTV